MEKGNEMAIRYRADKQEEFEKRRHKGTEKKEVRKTNREKDYPLIDDETWKDEMLHQLGPPGAKANKSSQDSSSEQESADANTMDAVEEANNPTEV